MNSSKNLRIAKPQKIISENGPSMAGEVICECGHQFTHSIEHNMITVKGFLVPSCPVCDAIPASETREMDG